MNNQAQPRGPAQRGVQIITVAEHRLTSSLEAQLSELLDTCFPDVFQGRTYFKQLPHWRVLAVEGESVLGQLGIDGRIINVGGSVLTIFGIIDVCVRPDRQGEGLASQLLAEAEGLARDAGRDFLVLIADRHDLYERHGFASVTPANVKWLAIEDRFSVTLLEEDLSGCFLVKPLCTTHWPTGQIDMLGYLF